MPTVEIVVPWMGDCPHRTAAAHWVLQRLRLAFPDAALTVASDRPLPLDEPPEPGPWVKARAVMPAVEASTADVVVVHDADVWCDGTGEAVAEILAGRARWGVPHWRTHRFTPAFTARVLDGADPSAHSSDSLEERPQHNQLPGGGIVVAPRALALDAPLDPRFQGWGGEDVAWGRALQTLGGKPWHGAWPLYHLWHPPQARPARTVLPPANAALWRRYHAAYRKPGRMRALLDEIPNQQGAQL